MSLLDGLHAGSFFLVASAGAWFDVRERRVPNVLTLVGLAVALLLGSLQGASGLAAALGGAALGFAVALPVFLLGGLGGGDVKFLAVLGAFLGPARMPTALLAIALVGGLMAAVEVVRRRAVGRTVMHIWVILKSLGPGAFSRWRSRPYGGPLTVGDDAAITLPYAVAIAAGAAMAYLL